jgi:hypothetical protein
LKAVTLMENRIAIRLGPNDKALGSYRDARGALANLSDILWQSNGWPDHDGRTQEIENTLKALTEAEAGFFGNARRTVGVDPGAAARRRT